jgi:LacI family transcriptional regulator
MLATIRDVARLAGVSIATVSRVFNGSPRVSQESARRVRAAATRLDYWPNSGARSLTTNRTHALGVLLPDLFGEFFSEVIRGIDHAARAEKLQILVSSSHADTEELVAAARAMRGRIDGLIAMVPDNGSGNELQQIVRRFPLVLLNPRSRIPGCSTVSIANLGGARAVVRHLLALGRLRIATIRGPRGNVDAEQRLRGYRDALRAASIAPEARLELQGDFTERSGYECGRELLRLRPRPTAVFAANDYMAIGLLRALRDAGVEVPREISVVGFDDIAFALYLDPPLTTVHVDAYALGERATRSLVHFMRAPRPSRCTHFVLPTALSVRASCGAETSGAAAAGPARRRRPLPEGTGRGGTGREGGGRGRGEGRMLADIATAPRRGARGG